MMKAIFLDRDGTLVKDYADPEWADITQLEIFPDTISALRKIPNYYKIFIVTNQYLIGESIITFSQFMKLHQELILLFEQSNIHIEQTYYCPHARIINCGCHKPETGMINQCLVNYDIDLSQSYFIGDTQSDISLAHAIGCHSIAIREYNSTILPTYYVKNLEDAISLIHRTD